MNRIGISGLAFVLAVIATGTSGCEFRIGTNGNITKVNDLQGTNAEVRVRTEIGQPAEDQPWIVIDDKYLDTCQVGTIYPDCKDK